MTPTTSTTSTTTTAVTAPGGGAPLAADVARLTATLAQRADAEGLVDVAYRTVDSPVGPLLVAATEAGVVRIAFSRQGFDDVLSHLATRVSPRVLAAPRRLDHAARELDEYFAGDRTDFDVPLDLQLAHGFRAAVLGQLRRIDYGRTASYADVAAALGNAGAVRAVGTACRLNPVPLLVPCHRVVRSDGSLGQYAGGSDAKALLTALEHEHAVPA